MISIRRRTSLLLCGAIALLLLGGGALIFWTIRASLIAQFDANLAAKAQALIAGADLDEGEVEIDSDLQEFAGFQAREADNYFEILGADGASLARSPSLGTSHLPVRSSGATPKYGSVKLPDGRSGRAYWRSFSPADDEGAMPGKLEVVVAAYSGGLERSLRNIMHILFVVGLTGLVLTVGIVHLGLKSGLRPLDQLAERVQTIEVTHLQERLPTVQLPRELQGIAEKLNEMLERLEAGFAREQRFSSDAAHELRTPLAELKVMTELVTRWPEEFDREHGQEMLRVIAESEALLDKLSLLSRAGTRGAVIQRMPLDLNEGVQAGIDKVRPGAEERGLTISTHVEGGTISTDPTLWMAILNNLLRNAVSHAPTGSQILVSASAHHLTVRNQVRDLDPQDVPRLFERFWRKSESRSEKGHSGLGLSIVAACSESLGGTCQATLESDRLAIEVRWDPQAM